MLRALPLCFVSCVLILASCGSTPVVGSPSGCTEIGCENGVRVDFTFRERGAYVFTVDVDGLITTCSAELPLPRNPPGACSREGVLLGLVGSMLPPDAQTIGGLTLTSTTAKKLSIRATRDGQVIGEKTFDVSYTVTPGPNGPNCEPKECKLAKLSFP